MILGWGPDFAGNDFDGEVHVVKVSGNSESVAPIISRAADESYFFLIFEVFDEPVGIHGSGALHEFE